MKLISKLAAALMLLGATAVFCGGAKAQEFRGTISGQVVDPSGAAVPGAQVTVREVHTGTVNRTMSDAAGQYVVPFLLPGDYAITVAMPGFQTLVRSNITLEAQAHPIVNLALAVGEATQTVTVTSRPPLLDLANASVGEVIDTKEVEDLPLDGRTPTTLTELSEGVITTAAPQLIHPFDNNAGNSWSIGGTPNQVSEVLLDGSPDLTLLGALAYAPTEDSVAEVSVRPFDTDASFGHTIGGVINQVTKSGTNRLHGSIYEFYQPTNLNANTYFDKDVAPGTAVTPTPSFHFNQYGLTVGGPVRIPHLYNGKDKLFFFFAWEGLKDSTPATTLTTVPTAAERSGDFSQVLAAGCPTGYANDPTKAAAICNADPAIKENSAYADPNQLYNPYSSAGTTSKYTRSPILNNQLTTVSGFAVNQVAAAYLALYPQPNNTAGSLADGQDNYISNAPSVDDYNNEFGRLDYNVSSRDHLFGDFRHNYRTQVKNNYFGNGITGSTLLRENFGLTIDNVFTLNPSTIFDTRVNWTFFNEVHGTPGQAYTPTDLGFPSYMNSNSELLQLPYINFNTGGSCGSFTSYQCLGDTGSAMDPTTSYQIFTDVVKVIGRHTLKAGFDGRQYRLTVQNYGDSSGSFTFNSNYVESGSGAAAQTFGGDLADFELGLPGSGEYDLNARADYHQYYVGAFVQDDWRVNDHLTLNLGARFDIDTPFREKFGRIVNGFDPTAVNMASGAPSKYTSQTASNDGVTVTIPSFNALGGLTFPSGNDGAVYNNNSGFLSPRIGFSYAPDDKWVFRGGFGIFVQPETLASLAATGSYSSSAISDQEGFSASTTYTGSLNSGFTPPANTLSNPFPGGTFNQPAGSSAGASTFMGESISFLAPYEHDPYSERWDLGVQRELTNNTLLEVMYVGNHALHLPVQQQNLNAVLPQYLSYAPFRNEGLALDYAQTTANPFKGVVPTGGSLNTGSTVALSNLIVPYPQFGTNAVYIQNQTIGQSYFNSAIVHLEQRATHGLTLTANYSFSKLIEADTFLNDEDTMVTRRISPFDHTHHFTAGGTYDLPFGRGKMLSFGGSRWANEIFGGWVINAIYQFQTGPPIEFSSDIPLQPGVTLRDLYSKPRDTNNPKLNPGQPLALPVQDFVTANSSTTCPANTACDFTGQTYFPGQYYDHYRTLPQTLSWVRADGFNNLDSSVLKNFDLIGGASLQLRFETFNTLNHPVFASPNVSSATASNFGEITSVYSNSTPRQVQLGARIVF